MTDESIWIACHPTSEPRGGTAVGWTRCEICRAKVWIAPSSIAVKKNYPNVTIACLECFVKAVAAVPGGGVDLRITAQQEIELFTATGITTTEAYQKIYGITPRKLP